ncbi:hypothetical protein ACGF1Z_31560 [Streptomyces sp. NPDC048018]|uniref:hypothetical protein n=1 Tax=Streptomyces sp. NPDC048018 TaxID=3365499 RepID=UPI0037194CDD
MSNPIEKDAVVKPQDMHATGGTEGEITTKDMHATSEPAIDAITKKVKGTGAGEITTMDMHATSEPLN